MNGMFSGAKLFNQDLSSWNVSKVTDMDYMFFGALNFNQNISSWDVTNVVFMSNMFFLDFEKNKIIESLSDENKCKIHTEWEDNNNWTYDWSSYCTS
jgi:surface protein